MTNTTAVVDLGEPDTATVQRLQDAACGGTPVLVRNGTTAGARALLSSAIGIAPDGSETEMVVCTTEHGAPRLVLPMTDRTTGRQLLEAATVRSGSPQAARPWDAYAPFIDYKADWVDEHGALSVGKYVAVGREIRKEGDRFHALVHDSVNVAPEGLGWEKKWRATVIESIKLSSHVRSDGAVTRSAQLPPTDVRTDISIESSRTQTIGFSVAAGREVGGGAGAAGPELTAKSSLSFVFNWSRETRQSMQWSIKDYTLENTSSSEQAHGGKIGSTTTWLSPAIANDAAYFPSANRLTPAMQRQQIEQLSEWTIDGSGTRLSFHTVVAGLRRTFDGWHTFMKPLEVPNPRRPNITIDLTSPFLSRNQTVYIQSRRNGRLLSGVRDVWLQDAPQSPSMLRQFEWELDELGRYRCRAGAGNRYLTMRPDGRLVLEPASLSLAQQWEWQADRLHCRSNPAGVPGALPFRLVAATDSARCHSGGSSRQYPVNPEHPILAPWSSYPSKPAAGDVIPRLDGVLPPIPDEWVEAGYQVLPEEQWQVIVVRLGLMNRREP